MVSSLGAIDITIPPGSDNRALIIASNAEAFTIAVHHSRRRSAAHCRCAPANPRYRRLAPVLRRDLHEEAVGIPEIDRRAACIGLIPISRFGIRQLAVDFVSEAFGSDR